MKACNIIDHFCSWNIYLPHSVTSCLLLSSCLLDHSLAPWLDNPPTISQNIGDFQGTAVEVSLFSIYSPWLILCISPGLHPDHSPSLPEPHTQTANSWSWYLYLYVSELSETVSLNLSLQFANTFILFVHPSLYFKFFLILCLKTFCVCKSITGY